MSSGPRLALPGSEPCSPSEPSSGPRPVFIVPQCSLLGWRATSTMQKMFYGKTAAVTQWVLCWHLDLICQQRAGLKTCGRRFGDVPLASSPAQQAPEVKNKENRKKASMRHATVRHRAHSPPKSCFPLSFKMALRSCVQVLVVVLGTNV